MSVRVMRMPVTVGVRTYAAVLANYRTLTR